MSYHVLRPNRIQFSSDNTHQWTNKTTLEADFRFEDQNTAKNVSVYFARKKVFFQNSSLNFQKNVLQICKKKNPLQIVDLNIWSDFFTKHALDLQEIYSAFFRCAAICLYTFLRCKRYGILSIGFDAYQMYFCGAEQILLLHHVQFGVVHFI